MLLAGGMWGCGDDSTPTDIDGSVVDSDGGVDGQSDGFVRPDGGPGRDAAQTTVCENAGLEDETVGPQAPGQCVTSDGIPIDACGVLDEAGATYQLIQDVESPSTCFAVAASDVTLDLCGYTVRYGSDAGERRYGVAVPPGYQSDGFPDLPAEAYGGADRVTVLNGNIVQADGNDGWRHGVYMRGCAECTLSRLRVTVDDPDSYNLHFRYCAGLIIDHNHLINRVVSVENRHYPGNKVISVPNIAEGVFEIHHNLIEGGAQWGIFMSDDDGNTADVVCHHNEIRHDTVVTNGYGIGAHADGLEIFANLILPQSGRGIHITGDGDQVYQNCVDVQERPNPEYPDGIQAHGIKFEGASQAVVTENEVWSWGRDGFGPGDPLDFGHSTENVIQGGTFTAETTSEEHWGAASVLIGVEEGSGNVVRNAVFESNHNIIRVLWDGGGGVLYDGCTFRLLDGGPQPAHTIALRIGHSSYARDIVLRDIVCEAQASLEDIDFLYSDYTWDQVALTIEWTAEVTVEDSNENPVADATVVITDVTDDEVFSGPTSTDGTIRCPLTHYIQHAAEPLSDGRELKTPHTVTVTPPGGGTPLVESLTVDGTGVSLTVTLN
jgi:hypothetical protein